MTFTQSLPSSQEDRVGTLKLHSQVEGRDVELQVSAFSRHWSSTRHEHGGCPGNIVMLRHNLPSSHASNDGALPLHSQVVGNIVVLHVSELS